MGCQGNASGDKPSKPSEAVDETDSLDGLHPAGADKPSRLITQDGLGVEGVVKFSTEPSDADGDASLPPSRIMAVERAEDLKVDQSGMEEAVYIHEGADLTAEDIEGQMAMIPEPADDESVVRPEDIQVGDPAFDTPEEINQVRRMIWRKQHLCMGKGNALPPAAKWVYCDIDVGDAKPVAQRGRKIPPEFTEKLFTLIKGLLKTDIIKVSDSPWASPIVIVVKKNGVDIRLYIDYRIVNALTRLMVYPMPVVNDLLENLDKILWYCSLDMASGFWVVKMTERAKKISAFITPFGLFQWKRMPFGLKNAPQIYQRLIDNALYAVMRIPKLAIEQHGEPSEPQRKPSDLEHEPSGQDDEPSGRDDEPSRRDGEPSRRNDEPSDPGNQSLQRDRLSDDLRDVFRGGEAAEPDERLVFQRRSYIDDILFGGRTWGEMCQLLERLLEACDEWGISISIPKSKFGVRKAEYLGHEISIEGIESKPKNLEEPVTTPFPRSLRGVQSFLGSLNYYHKFIEDFGAYAAVLYELTEADFPRRGQDRRFGQASKPSRLDGLSDVSRRTPDGSGNACDGSGYKPSEGITDSGASDGLHVCSQKLPDDRLSKAMKAFELLKVKIAEAPILKHFDKDKEPVIVVYANDWAISASLLQEHDGILMPVRFASRVLKAAELRYDIAEKEVLALLRILDQCFTMLVGRQIRVITRHSTMAWLLKAKNLQGRLQVWAVILSPWSLTIERTKKSELDLLGLVACSITPREQADDELEALRSRKAGPRMAYQPGFLALPKGEESFVVSFDGSAKPKRAGASFGVILWRVPGWEVVEAKSVYVEDGTVNEAEYRGLLEAARMARRRGVKEVVICGDSRLAIQQTRGEMDCKAPGLQLLWAEATRAVKGFDKCTLIHVKREFNASADYITGKALQRHAGEVISEEEYEDLRELNRLGEVFMDGQARGDEQSGTGNDAFQEVPPDCSDASLAVPVSDEPSDDLHKPSEHVDEPSRMVSKPSRADDEPSVRNHRDRSDVLSKIQAVRAAYEPSGAGSREVRGDGSCEATRFVVNAVRTRAQREASAYPTPEAVQNIRLDRIRTAQDEEVWISHLKAYIRGDLVEIPENQVGKIAKLVGDYEVDTRGILYFVGYARRRDENGSEEVKLKLVLPTTLHQDVLHHYHVSLAGGHQGVARTYAKVREHFHWRGIYRDVQDYVAACTDCQTGKGIPRHPGTSPGNIVAERPFQVIGMDHIQSLPRSHRGNRELLIWVDHHTGFLIVAANPSRTADEIAQAYERSVYRRFGASEVIRHDREPGFMAEVFRAFNRLIGQQSKATLAYRPQANGMAERMVQVITRAVKMYVRDPEQRDWDDYAEMLVFALNTAYERTRGDTPSYLVHGWDARTTLEAAIPTGSPGPRYTDAKEWRTRVQRQYLYARAKATDLLQEAMEERRDAHNEQFGSSQEEDGFVPGAQVWLYVNKVKPGYAKKLAHLWHGPFRIARRIDDHIIELETNNTDYRIFPMVHISRLKLRRRFGVRPTVELVSSHADEARTQAVREVEQAVLPGERAIGGEGQAVTSGDQAIRGKRQAIPDETQAIPTPEQAVRSDGHGVTDGTQAVRGEGSSGSVIRFDFDEALLPEDSWEPDQTEGVYEVEAILGKRRRKPTRYGRRITEYLIKWKGYETSDWVPEENLNCGGLIADFEERVTARGRYNVMQSADDQADGE